MNPCPPSRVASHPSHESVCRCLQCMFRPTRTLAHQEEDRVCCVSSYRQSEQYVESVITSIIFMRNQHPPPLNSMLNGEITSNYLHKGWISISDKIYPLHGFHTSSTFEMDMYKELNTAIIYIYIHMTSAHYIYNAVYIYIIYTCQSCILLHIHMLHCFNIDQVYICMSKVHRHSFSKIRNFSTIQWRASGLQRTGYVQ